MSFYTLTYRGRPKHVAWWRHQIKTFSALLALCAENSPVAGEFPAQRPVTRSLRILFDLRLKKRLSKQCWGWWFETLSRPLWRHCNGPLRSHYPSIHTDQFSSSSTDFFGSPIDFPWCRHQMETFYALLALCAGNSPMTGDFLKGQRRAALMFSLICVWTNGSVNNRDGGIWDAIALIMKSF